MLGDLGHAAPDGGRHASSYVCTRYYRAPELLLGYLGYGPAIDLWALGCVVAEMIRLKPLFWGDKNTSVLAKILSVLGNLSSDLVERYTGTREKLVDVQELGIESKVETKDLRMLQLIKLLLQLDDSKRLSAVSCLQFFR